MARIRGLLLYYRSFFLIPGLLLTTAACGLYYKNARYADSIVPAILTLKVITFGLTAYLNWQRKERYYFFNLGLSPVQLIVSACLIEWLIFFTLFYITSFFC